MALGDITYLLFIDALDVKEATFSGPSGVRLTLPRSGWEEAGKPSAMTITPSKVEDF